MRRWQNIVAVLGFLGVVTFAVVRLFDAGTRWADLRELAPDLASTGLFVVMVAAVPLGIFGLGYALWRTIWWKPPKRRLPEGQHPVATRLRLATEAAVLSVVMGLAVGFLSKMRSPGWQIAMGLGLWSGTHNVGLNLGLIILLGVGVDSTLCFGILWVAYLVWTRDANRNSADRTDKKSRDAV